MLHPRHVLTMATTMKARIQHPRYTAAALTAANPILLDGEVVYESDTHRHKVGDGRTAWRNLAYEAGGGGDIPEMTPVVGTDSTADFLGTSASVTDVLQKVIAATAIGKVRQVQCEDIQCMLWYIEGTGKVGVLGFVAASSVLVYGAVEYSEFPGGIFYITDEEIAIAVLNTCKGLSLEAIPAANIAISTTRQFASASEKSTWNNKADKTLSNVTLTKSLLASGYYKAPDGLMIQWGYTTTASATPTVYFPTSFYATPFIVIGSIKYSASNPPKTFSVSTTSMYTSYATFLKTFSTEGDTNSAVSEPFYWIAIGRWK